jgi:hypothetical protein
MLALGYRTGQAPQELASALAAPRVTVVELSPLTWGEAATLAGDCYTPDQLRAIFVESGGNPFYTLELVRAAQLPAHSRTGDLVAARTGVPRLVAAPAAALALPPSRKCSPPSSTGGRSPGTAARP